MKAEDLKGPVPSFVLAQRMLKTHPLGHQTVMIYGEKRYGKSIFALKVMWSMFIAMGHPKDVAFKMAMDCFKFRPRDFMDFIYEAADEAKGNEKNKRLVVCLDDASMALSGQSYERSETKNEYWELRDVWAMMGTAVSCVLLTTPNPEELSDKFTWNAKVHITKLNGEWERKAEGFSSRLVGKRKTRKDSRSGGFVDTFSGYLNNEYYCQLRELRMMYLGKVREKHRGIRDKKYIKLKEKEIEEVFGPKDASPDHGTPYPEQRESHQGSADSGIPAQS